MLAASRALDREAVKTGCDRALDANDLSIERFGVLQNIAYSRIHRLRMQAAGKCQDKNEGKKFLHHSHSLVD